MTDKDPGLKSAFDLAMERLEEKQGKVSALTDKQKKELADIDSEVKAKIAETEIMLDQSIMAARTQGNFEELQKLEEDKRTAIDKIRADGEERKEAVRNS